MEFNKIRQILSLVMSSLTSQGLKTDNFLLVCFFVCLFGFFVPTFDGLFVFLFYSGSRIQLLHRLVNIVIFAFHSLMTVFD